MTASSLPRPPRPRGRVLDARLHLLSRQVLDRHDVPVTTIDDLAFSPVPREGAHDREEVTGARTYVVDALLTGAALVVRVFGGRAPTSVWERVGWQHVSDVGTAIHLGVDGDELDVTWTERWVRDKIIRHIPGGRHDPE